MEEKRIIEAMMQGLSREEAEKSWYVNTPNAPEQMKLITQLLLESLSQSKQ
jgi:hypothetical protein